jgi:hypothetical protein
MNEMLQVPLDLSGSCNITAAIAAVSFQRLVVLKSFGSYVLEWKSAVGEFLLVAVTSFREL